MIIYCYYFNELNKLGITSLNAVFGSIKAGFIRNGELQLPPKIEGATYSHFVVLVADRNRWLREALALGIQLGWLIEYSIPEMPVFGEHNPEEFPISASYARSAINLPMWGGTKIARDVVNMIYNILEL